MNTTMSLEDDIKNLVDKTCQLNLEEQELQRNKIDKPSLDDYLKPKSNQNYENQVPKEPEINMGVRRMKYKKTGSSSKSQLAQIEPIRFYGKNYHLWAQLMMLNLKKLKIAYVLEYPYQPGEEGSSQRMTDVPKHMSDETKCRSLILDHLSICLLLSYTWKRNTVTAKALWEDLELKFGAGASTREKGLVKKYVNFRIKARSKILKKAQQFNKMRDSLGDLGMVIDENFHVNVLILKLPHSWKKSFYKSIGKEYVSGLATVMDFLRAEEGRQFKHFMKLRKALFPD